MTTSYGLTSYVHGRLDKPIYIFFISPLRFYSLVSNISSSLNLTLGVNPNRKIQIGSDHLFEMDWKITNLMSLNRISNFTCKNITRFDPPDYLVNFYFILFFDIFCFSLMFLLIVTISIIKMWHFLSIVMFTCYSATIKFNNLTKILNWNKKGW